MKIFIGTDHRGVDVEKEIVAYLKSNNFEVSQTTITHTPTDDYPDFAFEVCHNVIKNSESLGILICGTGIGMSIAANKVKGIRAAHCTTVHDASLTRIDNNSNVLCISYNLPIEDIYNIIDTFISTKASDDERHQRRINKIIKYENGEYNGL